MNADQPCYGLRESVFISQNGISNAIQKTPEVFLMTRNGSAHKVEPKGLEPLRGICLLADLGATRVSLDSPRFQDVWLKSPY